MFTCWGPTVILGPCHMFVIKPTLNKCYWTLLDLKWTDHINDVAKKANQTLGFLKGNYPGP